MTVPPHFTRVGAMLMKVTHLGDGEYVDGENDVYASDEHVWGQEYGDAAAMQVVADAEQNGDELTLGQRIPVWIRTGEREDVIMSPHMNPDVGWTERAVYVVSYRLYEVEVRAIRQAETLS